jgi:hypothetical protein
MKQDSGGGLFVLGLLLGIVGHSIFVKLEYTVFNKPKYQVGDCLSNGLFFQKVLSIRKSTFGLNPRYVTDTYFSDHNRDARPDTTETWIADQDYVKVDSVNCTSGK